MLLSVVIATLIVTFAGLCSLESTIAANGAVTSTISAELHAESMLEQDGTISGIFRVKRCFDDMVYYVLSTYDDICARKDAWIARDLGYSYIDPDTGEVVPGYDYYQAARDEVYRKLACKAAERAAKNVSQPTGTKTAVSATPTLSVETSSITRETLFQIIIALVSILIVICIICACIIIRRNKRISTSSSLHSPHECTASSSVVAEEDDEERTSALQAPNCNGASITAISSVPCASAPSQGKRRARSGSLTEAGPPTKRKRMRRKSKAYAPGPSPRSCSSPLRNQSKPTVIPGSWTCKPRPEHPTPSCSYLVPSQSKPGPAPGSRSCQPLPPPEPLPSLYVPRKRTKESSCNLLPQPAIQAAPAATEAAPPATSVAASSPASAPKKRVRICIPEDEGEPTADMHAGFTQPKTHKSALSTVAQEPKQPNDPQLDDAVLNMFMGGIEECPILSIAETISNLVPRGYKPTWAREDQSVEESAEFINNAKEIVYFVHTVWKLWYNQISALGDSLDIMEKLEKEYMAECQLTAPKLRRRFEYYLLTVSAEFRSHCDDTSIEELTEKVEKVSAVSESRKGFHSKLNKVKYRRLVHSTAAEVSKCLRYAKTAIDNANSAIDILEVYNGHVAILRQRVKMNSVFKQVYEEKTCKRT